MKFPPHLAKLIQAHGGTVKPERPHKYRAVRTGHYASKAEARYAAHLATLKQAGAILDWLEQVPIMLPGRVRYLVDFMVIDRDGTVRFVECKGMETQVWINKRKQLQELRPEIYKRLEVVR